MTLWCYLQTAIAPLPVIPYYFYLSQDDKRLLEQAQTEEARRSYLEILGQNRGILTREFSGAVRYCETCSLIKPDRCHHCSMCRRCVLHMDHHCPWFNNCVCYSNYKYFLLTLFYTLLTSAFCVTTTSLYVPNLWSNVGSQFVRTFHVTFLDIVGVVLLFGLGSFLYYHITLVLANSTTLENMRDPVFKVREDSFNIGWRENFLEVFGSNPLLWLIPVFSTRGDGARFPTVLHRNRNALGAV
ncbi:palmitoyltransferase ZDHHC2-like [Ornithodoros turicata]|uniref:palmitoyltransferase ZDHHC2-like n=1 Tax=Ornithodoros turicata TaxID=34597 RepID=UPI00313874E8